MKQQRGPMRKLARRLARLEDRCRREHTKLRQEIARHEVRNVHEAIDPARQRVEP